MRLGALLACALALAACSGRTETRVSRYANGQRWSEIGLRGGVPHGRWQTWYENGEPKSDGEYVDGKREGVWTSWWENGQKQCVGRYENGRRVGPWATWFASGQEACDGRFERGLREGVWTEWFGDGTTRRLATFHAGREDLVARGFASNGELVHEWTYRDGVLEGPYREFDEEGNELALGEYAHGRPNGTWLFFRADGGVDEERAGLYEDGVRVRPVQDEERP